MARLVLSSFCLAAMLFTTAWSPASADMPDPRKWCADVTDAVASRNVEAVPAMAIDGARGEMAAAGAAGFLGIKPVTEAGDLRLNAFLTEKNYNDAYLKVWHLLMFGSTALYVRCTFIKDDEGWMLYNLSFDTDEANIALP